jgi:hypothetical protein
VLDEELEGLRITVPDHYPQNLRWVEIGGGPNSPRREEPVRGCTIVCAVYWFDELRRKLRLGEAPSPEHTSRLAEEFERIARQIDPSDLQRSDEVDWGLTEAELLGDLVDSQPHATRISNFYTPQGLEFALERYGLLGKIRSMGFSDLRFTYDIGDTRRQHITCRGSKGGGEHLLMDLMMGRISIPAPGSVDPADDLQMLSIEWMMLQNPTEEFAPDHPRWPGQEHPGLGLNEEVMLLHILGARRLGLDGIVNHPSRYHVAFLGRDRIYFLDPGVQGRFDALREALSNLQLSEAAWRMERNEVCWADDESPVEWWPRDYIFPISDRLVAYFKSPSYQEPRSEGYRRALERAITIDETTEGSREQA